MSAVLGGVQRPPGPDGWPLLGNTVQYAREPFDAIERWHDRYGDVVYLRFPTQPTYMVTDPDLIERVLVTDSDDYVRGEVTQRVFGDLERESVAVTQGEQWRRQRTLVQPAFALDRIRSYGETMTEFATDLVDRLEDGQRIDVREEMSRLTLRILAKALFDLDVREDREGRVVREAASALVEKADYTTVDAYLPDWVPTPANRRFNRTTAELKDLVDDLVDRRRADPGEDLLSTLIAAGEDGNELSRTELRDNMIGLLLAGHETSAVALTYAWYALARNPDARDRLHGEVDALGGPPAPADVFGLEYTERVMDETLRLYPPSFAVLREPTRDVELGGYPVPEGTTVMAPQWILHRDDRYFEAPLEFRPDRWTGGLEEELPDYAYFPFGGGPHHCLGMRFARMEIRLVLATMARRLRLELSEDRPLEFTASITLRPKDPIEMRVRER